MTESKFESLRKLIEKRDKYPQYIVVEQDETTIKVVPDNTKAVIEAMHYKNSKKKKFAIDGRIVEFII